LSSTIEASAIVLMKWLWKYRKPWHCDY